jgi:glycosyltransferase involved in cell wall biosynthesis
MTNAAQRERIHVVRHRKSNDGLRASVVLTTYNSPHYLELALEGYRRQTVRSFEVVVADDGSRDETRALVERIARAGDLNIVHCWQEDRGFRQARVMNLGVLHSSAPLIVFSDGDCVPPVDFVEQHIAAHAPRRLTVGWCLRLTREVTAGLVVEDVRSGRVERLESSSDRFAAQLLHLKNAWYRLVRHPRRPRIQGLNFSIDRDLLVEVNGFDLAFENCARQDSDLRNRVRRLGERVHSIVDRCRVVHLWHPEHSGRHGSREAYENYDRRNAGTRAPRGLRELAEELGSTV